MANKPVVEDLSEVPTNRDKPREEQPEIISLAGTKCGFIVGVDEQGEWIWRPFGTAATLDSLIGCLYHAYRQLTILYDVNTKSGDQRVHQVGLAVAGLTDKVDQILNAVGLKRSGTSI